MNVTGKYNFPGSAQQLWDFLLDPRMLLQVVPGLQSVDIKPDGTITFDAILGLGPVRGTFNGKMQLTEQKKPSHVRILGEGKGTVGSLQGTCDIDVIEDTDCTRIEYNANVQLGGALKRLGQPFLHRAVDVVMRRSFDKLRARYPSTTDSLSGAQSALGKVAQTWDEMDNSKVRQVAWSSISYLSQSYAREFSGSEPSSLYVHRKIAERLAETRTGLKGAALVCGDMAAERGFFEADQILQFVQVDGFDISSVSLSKYQPQKFQFNPSVTDCNNFILEPNAYDLVVTCYGAHHVYNLGNFFYQAAKSLKKNGLFYMVEWIGPEYLQIPRVNHWISSLLLFTLFDRKTRTTHVGQLKGRWVQYPPAALEPSEACNSTELFPQFLKYFNPINTVSYAGLAYPVFEGIAQNIDESTRNNRAKLKLVHGIEKMLTRLGIIQPLFVMAVGERKEGIF